MEYKISLPFTGSSSAAIGIARAQFITNGFKVDQPNDAELAVLGPGMHSTNQNPILGVSRAKITVSSGSINFYAELGGVTFMQRFVYIFPPALVIFMAIVFACVPTFPRHTPFLTFVLILPWLIISPLMARWIKNRTIAAVDTLVHNMTHSKGIG